MTNSRILLFGKEGQIGYELQKSLKPFKQVCYLGKDQANFEQPTDIARIIRDYKPTIIINAAAYTSVDKAEIEPEKAQIVNTQAVQVLAEEAKLLNAWFIHYSTDYVFDGEKKEPYVETDQPNPINMYGKSKLAGEQAILDAQGKHIILRNNWVYSNRKKNFLLSILKQANKLNYLSVVMDCIGAPTSARLIADTTTLIVENILQGVVTEEYSGIYHLCAQGYTTCYDYAKFIIIQAHKLGLSLNVLPEQIVPITTEAYQHLASRPLNSKLSTDKISSTFDITFPDWQDGVIECLTEISKNNYDVLEVEKE